MCFEICTVFIAASFLISLVVLDFCHHSPDVPLPLLQ